MNAHASSRNPEHTVFVGNIPYGVTEEMLTEIFSEVGPVKYFRLVTDRETGRQKGFGFCEYYDKDTAQSAIRNLGGHEVNGRHLRVDCTDASNEKGDRKPNDKSQGNKQQGHIVTATEAAHAAQGMAAAVGSTNLGPGQDQITDALSKMPRAALYDIMAQMKGLIQQNQQQARQILVTNPSLTRALFQAQILLGMLKNPLSAEPAPQGPPQQGPPQQPMPGPAPGPAPQQQQYQPHVQQQQQAPVMRPQHAAPASNLQYPPQDLQPQPQQGLPGAPQPLRNPHAQPMGSMPGRGQGKPGPRPAAPVQSTASGQQYGAPNQPGATAGQAGPGTAARRPHDPRMRGNDLRQQAHPRPMQPVQQPQGQPQAQPQGPQQQQAAGTNLPAEQQKVLLQQIMQLSPAQIEGLPPEQKAQVLALQQQMRVQPGMLQ